MCSRSCLLLLLAVAAARAQCPGGLTPANYTTPSGVPVAPCCYKGADGQPCCDGLGNPCRILEDSPDCCDGTAGGCYALFNRDGVDSVNFKVTGPSGGTEDKRCIWDGSSPTGHGRCFAPTLENWQGPLSQAALIDDGTPPLRDMIDQPVCLSNSVAVGQTTVRLSCDYPTEDGSPCYANQRMGTCKASQCRLEAAAVAFAPASSVSPTQQQMGSPLAGKQAPISALPPDQQPIPPAYSCSGLTQCQTDGDGASVTGSQSGDQTIVSFTFPSICNLLGVSSALGNPPVTWTSIGTVVQNGTTAVTQQSTVDFGDGNMVVLRPGTLGTDVIVNTNNVTQNLHLSTVQDLIKGVPNCSSASRGRRLLGQHLQPKHSRALLFSTDDCRRIDFYCRFLITFVSIGLCQDAAGILEVIDVACNPVFFPESIPFCIAALGIAVECTGILSPTPSLTTLCDYLANLDGCNSPSPPPMPLPTESCVYASPDQNCRQVTRLGVNQFCCNGDPDPPASGVPCDGDLSQPFCGSEAEVVQPPYFFPGSGPIPTGDQCAASCALSNWQYIFTCCTCPDGYSLDLTNGGPDCAPYPICVNCSPSNV